MDGIQRQENAPPTEGAEDTEQKTERPVVIDGICREGDIVHLLPTTKTNSDLLIADLGLCASGGKPWAGFDIPSARKVLILEGVIGEREAVYRNAEASKGRELIPWPHVETYMGRSPEEWDLVDLSWIAPERGLVIVNTFDLFAAFGGVRIEDFEEVARRLEATFILVGQTPIRSAAAKLVYDSSTLTVERCESFPLTPPISVVESEGQLRRASK